MAYGEVQGKTWRSPSFRGMTDSQKLAWPYFLSNKHSNMLGYYELPISYMAEDLEWAVEKAAKTIKTLEARGLIAYDHAAQIVFVCKYLKYNSLSRGARETGAITRLDDLIDSPLLFRLLAAINEWQPKLKELIASIEKRRPNGSLFGDPEDSARSPSGDVVIDIEEAREEVDFSETDSIIDHLNVKAKGEFRHSKHSRQPIGARMSEGASVADCKLLIDFKCMDWIGDGRQEQYLRPQTLFAPSHFEGYLSAAKRWDAKGRPSKNGKGETHVRDASEYEDAFNRRHE